MSQGAPPHLFPISSYSTAVPIFKECQNRKWFITYAILLILQKCPGLGMKYTKYSPSPPGGGGGRGHRRGRPAGQPTTRSPGFSSPPAQPQKQPGECLGYPNAYCRAGGTAWVVTWGCSCTTYRARAGFTHHPQRCIITVQLYHHLSFKEFWATNMDMIPFYPHYKHMKG